MPKKKPIDKEQRIYQILRLLDLLMHEDGVDVELATKFDPSVKITPSGIPLLTLGTCKTTLTVTTRPK